MTINKILTSFKDRNLLIALLMGYASGFPLLLIKNVLKLWLKESGYALSEITKISLMGIPYSLKFIWSPLCDHFSLTKYGRRKSWLFISQLIIAIALILLACLDPKINYSLIFYFAFIIAFFSATQDIVIDAYRRETLSDEKLALGSSLYVYGYRLALWFTRTIPLILAQYYSWKIAYISMALVMLINCLVTFFAIEPKNSLNRISFTDSVILPLKEFFSRTNTYNAIIILLFIFSYKIGDSIASTLTMPFYLNLGFEKTTIAIIDGNFGSVGIILGLLVGSLLMNKLSIKQSLLLFGILQIISTLFFAGLTLFEKSNYLLGFTIFFENLSAGMGTAAFATFISQQTNKKYTATQYALLSAIMSIPLNILGGFSGNLAELLGYYYFFIFCGFIGLPGIFLINKLTTQYPQEALSN